MRPSQEAQHITTQVETASAWEIGCAKFESLVRLINLGWNLELYPVYCFQLVSDRPKEYIVRDHCRLAASAIPVLSPKASIPLDSSSVIVRKLVECWLLVCIHAAPSFQASATLTYS